MTLTAGTRLGPYELSEMLGAGGMGEVYKARDTRLERSVAIKVLPSHLSSSPGLRERFEREAKAISSISHPNICALYDVGSAPGTQDAELHYLVMEYLEGESLADRLGKGPLPLEQVLRYGVEIASALDKAHRAGIVHRDLKPGNIMLTKGGAKLLDFGLAKYAQSSQSVELLTSLPTEHKPLTQEGTILGTFQYMAPEQLAGEEADARTDIFAFGAVLYEMLTGARAFQGKNKTSLIGAIVSGEPRPVSALQPLTPPALEHVIRKCLAKEPDDRWQSAHDISEELKWIGSTSASSLVAPGKRRRMRLVVPMIAIASAIAGAAAMWLMFRNVEARQSARVAVALPNPSPSGAWANPNIAISPDGNMIAATFSVGDRDQLCLRHIEKFDFLPIAGTQDASAPFFSFDGQWIGFFASGALKKVSITGGAPQTLAPAMFGRGGSWSREGTIYYTPNPGSGIWKVPASGGTPQKVTEPDAARGENSHRWPHLLPDGKHLLMTVRTDRITSFDEASIDVLSLESGKRTTIVEGGSNARYLTSGHVVFGRNGRLLAVPFVPGSSGASGPSVVVVEGISTLPESGAAFFDVATETGDLIYLGGAARRGKTRLLTADRHGKTSEIAILNQGAVEPSVSPDDERIAFRVPAANDDVWVYEIARETFTRVSFEPGNETRPAWMPDSRRLVFGSERNSRPALLWRYADGSGTGEEITTGHVDEPMSCSPDGKLVAFRRPGEKTGDDIWLARLEGTADPKPFLQTPFNEFQPVFSPKGNLLAYVSDESGKPEVYVRSLTPGGGRWQVSTQGGFDPTWSRDGSEIYYRKNDDFYAVAVSSVEPFRFGRPALMFSMNDIDFHDVLGKGFLLTKRVDDTNTFSHFNLIFRWSDDVAKRVRR